MSFGIYVEKIIKNCTAGGDDNRFSRKDEELPFLDMPLLELLETPQEDGPTVQEASFRKVSNNLKAAVAHGKSIQDAALFRLINKATTKDDIDDIFDLLNINRLKRYESGARVPYTYYLSGALFDQAVSSAGERYVIRNLPRFKEEQLPLARWRLRPLFKYCAFERPYDVKKIWEYAKSTDLGKELGSEAVSVFRVYLDNDMLEEAKIFRDSEVRPLKVRLSGSEALRKSIYFVIDEKARWIKSSSFVKKKGLDPTTGQRKRRTTISITPEEHSSQPPWMDFARTR